MEEDQYLDVQKKQRWHTLNPRTKQEETQHDREVLISDADMEVHKCK